MCNLFFFPFIFYIFIYDSVEVFALSLGYGSGNISLPHTILIKDLIS